ncbi:MAG TPA: glycosyltransferase family 2 protein [Dehalococcoidia bacterium]|nr:glycosyltransferase family 2 protein [Dehalococcoidia bacterium]
MSGSTEKVMAMMIKVSIIIPTKNGADNIGECLRSVFEQDFEEGFEVLVIDSGSTDSTLNIVQRFPIKLFQIKPEEFSHSATRNYGVELAQGEYVVFLTQDATPLNNLWLRRITDNFKDPEVVGVSGRQVPREDAAPMERHWLSYFYPSDKRIVCIPGKSNNVREGYYYFFSDVNSAMRRKMLLEHKFPENIIMAEDKAWCRKVLLAGYTVVYEPEAIVCHSHHYSLKRAFKNSFSGGMAYAQFCERPEEFQSLFFIKQSLQYFFSEMRFLATSGHIRYIPYAVVYDIMKYIGRFLGRQSDYLPHFLRVRFGQ